MTPLGLIYSPPHARAQQINTKYLIYAPTSLVSDPEARSADGVVRPEVEEEAAGLRHVARGRVPPTVAAHQGARGHAPLMDLQEVICTAIVMLQLKMLKFQLNSKNKCSR